MPLHLTKIAFGCTSLAMLETRLASRGRHARLTTRYRPKRADEIIGGSLYWIVAHKMVARSPIIGFEDAEGGRTNIVIEARCIPLVSRPKRAHQGWRYLEEGDAPADLLPGGADEAALPAALQQELADIGLL